MTEPGRRVNGRESKAGFEAGGSGAEPHESGVGLGCRCGPEGEFFESIMDERII